MGRAAMKRLARVAGCTAVGRKRCLAGALLPFAALSACTAFAALDVEERDGALTVVRDGRTPVGSIAIDCGDMPFDGTRSSFATIDGAELVAGGLSLS